VDDDAAKVHVVVGASGGTGGALVRELVRRGRRVRAVNRTGSARVPDGVEVVAGDATDPARMREVCRGAGVVYNAVNPPFTAWREAFPAAVDGVLAGAQAAGARMVFVDDTWMYGPVDGPMTEDLPSRPVSDRGVLRAWLAEKVLAAHAAGRVRTVIGRAPELYGPGVESVLGRTVFGAAVSGRRPLWIGELDQPLAPMFIDDFAHGLAQLGEADGVLGAVWHLPTPGATTARELFALVSAAVQRPLRVRVLGDRAVRALGAVWPVAREGAPMLYQFRQPHVVDAGRYLARFGPGQVTPYDRGVALTLDWYRTAGGVGLRRLGS
jgi:nucleoside-diphosphate-sugar epimerase